jgi:hypothetical protein
MPLNVEIGVMRILTLKTDEHYFRGNHKTKRPHLQGAAKNDSSQHLSGDINGDLFLFMQK